MNDETLAKIRFDAEWDARAERMREDGARECSSCGCWDEPFGLMPAVVILPTAVGIDPICEECNEESVDSLAKCAFCGEWDYWADGWHPIPDMGDGVESPWCCHFCLVNRGHLVTDYYNHTLKGE